MTSASRRPLSLDRVAASLACLLDTFEGIQCWIKGRDGRYRWINRGFLLNHALERVDEVVGRFDRTAAWSEMTKRPLVDADGRIVGTVGILLGARSC